MVFNSKLSFFNNTSSLPYLVLAAVLLGSIASEAAGHAILHPRPEHMKMRERETTRVPHLIHQSWKSQNLSSNFERWQASWRVNHPHWEYKFWDDEGNSQLVSEYYPWFKSTYDALSQPVMKADACRYLYMHRFGGIYADLDFESLRSLEPLLQGEQLVLAAMTAELDWHQSIPNAWMASARRHPFWLYTLAEIIRAVGANDTQRWDFVEATTGPIMLHTAVAAYRAAGGSGLTILDPGVIYPIDWRHTTGGPRDGEGNEHSVCNPPHPKFNDTACKLRFPDAYALTYWTHTWG